MFIKATQSLAKRQRTGRSSSTRTNTTPSAPSTTSSRSVQSSRRFCWRTASPPTRSTCSGTLTRPSFLCWKA